MNFPESFSNIPGRETLARSQVLKRSWPVVLDLCVAGIGLACFYAVVRIANYWFGHPVPEIVISLSPRALPLYAFYSVVRIGLAYLLSLLFAVGYGYVAAYSKRVEALMIAGLDILQSIPVLSFFAWRDAGDGCAVSDAADRSGDGSDCAHLHRSGVEYAGTACAGRGCGLPLPISGRMPTGSPTGRTNVHDQKLPDPLGVP